MSHLYISGVSKSVSSVIVLDISLCGFYFIFQSNRANFVYLHALSRYDYVYCAILFTLK